MKNTTLYGVCLVAVNIITFIFCISLMIDIVNIKDDIQELHNDIQKFNERTSRIEFNVNTNYLMLKDYPKVIYKAFDQKDFDE